MERVCPYSQVARAEVQAVYSRGHLYRLEIQTLVGGIQGIFVGLPPKTAPQI